MVNFMSKTIAISPGCLSGTVIAPPSKSAAHRALICAALAKGTSVISNIALSDDISATLAAVRMLGAEATVSDGNVTICSAGKRSPFCGENIFCNESGSTLRFLIPILLSFGGRFTVSGRGRLMQRPLDDYFQIFDQKGIQYELRGDKLQLEGTLLHGRFSLAGNVSSQYITGLLFALPLLSGDSEIVVTTPVESVGDIDMTLEMMRRFGVRVQAQKNYRHFYVPGNQTYQPQNVTVEGDYSQAAFYLVANELGSKVCVTGLSESSSQGDKEIVNMIERLKKDEPVHIVDVSQVPDLVPVLSVLAAKAKGITRIVGASRLRLKESDRLRAVCTELKKLGVLIKEENDALEICGASRFFSAVVDSHNDHRMAMALAIAATAAEGDVVICGADSVKKSYGNFWEKFAELGGAIHECQQPMETCFK